MSIKAEKDDASTRNSSDYEKVDLGRGSEGLEKKINSTQDKVCITSSTLPRFLMRCTNLDNN
jgi:hypothetical protein